MKTNNPTKTSLSGATNYTTITNKTKVYKIDLYISEAEEPRYYLSVEVTKEKLNYILNSIKQINYEQNNPANNRTNYVRN